MSPEPGHLSTQDLAFARASVPVLCVDLVPVRSGQVGLILREMPGGDGGPVWCHLGGRVRRGETVRRALRRHVVTTLAGVDVELPEDPQPAGVVQWFPSREPVEQGLVHGYDPRQHAVALVHAVQLRGQPSVIAGGEALDFRWWARQQLAGLDLWPGALHTVRTALGDRR